MIKVNEYFNGNVKSMLFAVPGGPATVGVVSPGEYEFGTVSREVITVINGKLTVRLPGADSWKDVRAGETFTVDPNRKFQLRAGDDTAYLCLYR
jgi:purine/pyrimidine-nucleoside phosphorylase